MKRLAMGIASFALSALVWSTLPAPAFANCGKCGGDKKAPAATVKVINAKCPILGSKIDSNNVPEKLTRTYKDQKIGFCCTGCPEKWDKLTDAEKDAKLAAAMN